MSNLSPVQRHWQHVEALRQVWQGMPAGAGRERVKARWEEALADHKVFIKSTE